MITDRIGLHLVLLPLHIKINATTSHSDTYFPYFLCANSNPLISPGTATDNPPYLLTVTGKYKLNDNKHLMTQVPRETVNLVSRESQC